MKHDYQVQVVKSPKAFRNLEQEWDKFAEQCGDDAFFSRSIFVQEAWQIRSGKQQHKMHLILVRQGEELVFAMPLYVSRKWFDKASLKWLDSMTPSFCNNVLIKTKVSINDMALLLEPHFRSLFRLQVVQT